MSPPTSRRNTTSVDDTSCIYPTAVFPSLPGRTYPPFPYPATPVILRILPRSPSACLHIYILPANVRCMHPASPPVLRNTSWPFRLDYGVLGRETTYIPCSFSPGSTRWHVLTIRVSNVDVQLSEVRRRAGKPPPSAC